MQFPAQAAEQISKSHESAFSHPNPSTPSPVAFLLMQRNTARNIFPATLTEKP
jgi:hypothetical protein